MSGIALIIPGADFSNSPLGQVTFQRSINERVDEAYAAYALASGVSSNPDDVKTLIRGLMTNDLWDKVEVYPMLGTTRASVRTPLNPNAVVWFGSITFPSNAVVNNGYVSLSASDTSATCPAGEQQFEQMSTGKKDEIVGYYLFANFKKTSNEPSTSQIIGGNFGIQSKPNANLGQAGLGFGCLRGYEENCDVQVLNKRVSAATILTTTGFTGYADGEVVVTHAQDLNDGSLQKNNALGMKNTTGGYNFIYTNADVYMAAIGKIDNAKVTVLNDMLDTFVRAVKSPE